MLLSIQSISVANGTGSLIYKISHYFELISIKFITFIHLCFQNLVFKGSCDFKKIFNTTFASMMQTMSHDIEQLLPYVNYKVIIQAVNAKGEGNFAEIEKTTLEEGKHL